ncbi:MAG: hypothetical protein Kow0047_12660 [Anaerolineae bacterium]
MPEYKIYTLHIRLLTPLHIGSGVTLLHEYDYAIRDGRTWRINDTALLDAQDVDDPKLADQLSRTPPVELLRQDDYQPDRPFFRYVIQGTPASAAHGAQLQEQIKDPFDRPYLPGSSLKGAIRTALAWHGWRIRGVQADPARLGTRRQWAGLDFERQIFGRDPNHDLLRALHVSDSEPLDASALMVVNVRVLNRGGTFGSPIEVEALKPDTALTARLKLDLALFSDWAGKEALPDDASKWLLSLAGIAQTHARNRARRELTWFSQIPNGDRIAAFYEQLVNGQLESNQFLLQVGWGAGWGAKTLGMRLEKNQAFMEHVISTYRLARKKRQPGDPFPKSRRVAVIFGRDGEPRPVAPLGWALVEIEP